MKRTTIMLPRFEARRRGVSKADVAREVIATYLPERAERFTFIGVDDSTADDTSERVDAEVARLVSQRHERARQ